MKSIKPLLVGVLAASLALSPLAEARLGVSSHSSSRSYSSSSSSSSYSASSSNRLGGGSSVGMSRSDVMNNVRSGGAPTSYGASSGAAGYGSSNYGGSGYGGGYPPPNSLPPRQGPGWGTVAGAAAAAGAAGYLLGHNNSPTYVTPGVNNGGLAGNTVSYGAPASSGFSFASLLLWLLIIGGGIFLVRRLMGQRVRPQPVLAPLPPIGGGFGGGFGNDIQNSSLARQAEATFRELQDINGRGNREQLRAFCTPELFAQLQEGMGGNTQVLSLHSQVVDDSGGLVSVRYQGTVSEGGGPAESVDEVWHFVHNRNPGEREWLLAGIEQV